MVVFFKKRHEEIKMKSMLSKGKFSIGKMVFSLACLFYLSLQQETYGGPPHSSSAGVPQGFADVVAPLMPAVVNISTLTHVKKNSQAFGIPQFPQFPPGSPLEEFFRDFLGQLPESSGQPRSSKVVSLGSGFIIDPSGYIVTNNHVVADADQITALLNDGTKLKAKLVGRDQRTDLALLKVEAAKPLPFVTWGDANKTRVGDLVVAIGNPFGLGGTVTTGIISHIGRDISAKVGSSYIDGYFQTDAAINMGNSGGPMFNMAGQVIGVNTAIYSPTGASVGLAFSIPSFICQTVIEQLKKFGRTKRGWIGVQFQRVDQEIAESVNLSKPVGALVGRVIPGGPADKAKVEQGDIILKINGILVEDSKRFPRVIGGLTIGSSVPLVVWRKDKKTGVYREIPLTITIEEYESAEESGLIGNGKDKRIAPKDDMGISMLGLKLKTLTPALRHHFELNEKTRGVLIVSVDPDSVAEEQDIKPGDVIVEVSQEEVNTVEDIIAKIKKARREKRKSVLLLIARDEDVRFVSLRLDEEELSTPRPKAR